MNDRTAAILAPAFLAGGGRTGALLRAHDWSDSPLGDPAGWPQSLRSVVGLLLGSAFPMFLAWGPKRGFLYNDAYAQILGAKHPRAIGRRFRDVWPEIWPDVEPLVEAAMRGDATYRENLPLVLRRNGFDERAWFTFSYSPVRDESGGVAGMFCACAETTGQVLGAERLRASETRYRTLFESIDSGFCVVEVNLDAPDGRLDHRVVEANPAFERHTGLVGAQGRWMREFVPGLEEHWFETYGRVARTGEAERFESGSAALGRWFDVHALRVGAPEDRRVAILFNDISARRLAEERLRQLNGTLEQQVLDRTAERDRIWDTSPELMLVIDFAGVFRHVNPAWTDVLGYGPDELIGHHVNEFVLAEDHSGTTEAYELAGRGGRPTISNRYRHKDGSVRWISWVAAPAGSMTYATGRDVTAERHRAEALETAREALRQSQKMEAVGQLTGGIAHDFNNMLAVVLGSLDLLGRRLGADDARSRRHVDAATASARRAALLTQRLLAFSRRQPLQPEPVDVDRLVAGMSELFRGAIGPDVRFETLLAPGLWRAHADPNQLENALLNLAVNARDAMPDGGRLAIEARNAFLDARDAAAHGGVPAGQYVRVAVTDTGAGMSEDVLAKAFDPFFTTKPVGKGTGLGLSQVYGFVKQSGGHVTIDSAIGRGTTVEVYLPRLPGTAADGAVATSAP